MVNECVNFIVVIILRVHLSNHHIIKVHMYIVTYIEIKMRKN